MSRHKTGYIISYHGILCHDMSYVDHDYRGIPILVQKVKGVVGECQNIYWRDGGW